MLKNNKGFMLAEAVITSAVVITSLVALYTSYNKLYTKYQERSKYYNVDGYYANITLVKALIDQDKLNYLLSEAGDSNIIYLIKDKTTINQNFLPTNCNNLDEKCTQTKNIIEFYNITNSIIIKATQESLTALLKENLTTTFKDYLNNYVNNNYDLQNPNLEYQYIILTEYQTTETDKVEYNYSSMPLK